MPSVAFCCSYSLPNVMCSFPVFNDIQEPPDVTGKTLHTVKTSNATYGHHGEMAWQQMYFF